MKNSTEDWAHLTYLIDKTIPVLINPVNLMVAGFVLTNVLEHTQMGNQTVDNTKTPGQNWFTTLFPQWRIFFPVGPPVTTTQPLTILTEDQANVLRAGLVAVAASNTGVFQSLVSAVGSAIK